MRVVDPAHGNLLADVPATTPEQLDAAFVRARAAQPAWGARSFRDRARALRQFTRRLRDDAPLLATLTAESGKPRYEAEVFELLYTLELTRFYTGRQGRRALADQKRTPFLFPHKRTHVIHHPRGVVAVIGPWNWPLLNNFADAIAPLVAGNAVLLKPSEWTPLTSLRVMALWRDAGLPEGVFQVVTGGGDVGRALVERADMIFFTGSDRTGREVAKAAAARLVPAVLELGGKSAMIVLADADIERAARAAVWSAFAHSGQICIRTERVFVEAPVADAFVAACVAATASLGHGPSGDPDVFDVGAMTFPPQLDHLDAQIADALARGAKLLCGGERVRTRPGNWFPPTLLADVTPDMRVMHEETFGPLLPVMRVANGEEALQLTNASRFGLAGSIWSRDQRRAQELARRIESGSVCVNDVLFHYLCVQAPLGGVKQSGLGLRHGPEALRQFCRVETIMVDAPLLGWLSRLLSRWIGFPYRRRVLRIARWAMRWLY